MAVWGKGLPARRDVAVVHSEAECALLTCIVSCSSPAYVRTAQNWSCPCAKQSRK